MRKGICFLLFIFTGLITLQAQSINQWVTNPDSDEKVLVGYGNRDGLQSNDFQNYFKKEYNAYNPNDTVCDYLQNKLDSINIIIVLGTWCHDSQEQVPRYYKTLDQIQIDPERITLIGVDRDKKGGEVDVSDMDIQLVPTFIFYKKDKELGRIVETPMTTLEEDMMLILRNQ